MKHSLLCLRQGRVALSLIVVMALGGACERESEPVTIQFQALCLAPAVGAVSRAAPLTPAGASSATDLQSLGYVFTYNRLLQDDASADGLYLDNIQVPEGYENIDAWYDAFDISLARANPGLFTDLMEPASLAALSAEIHIGPEQVGSYALAQVNIMRPFFARASVTLSDGTILRTKDGTALDDGMGGLFIEVPSITEGDAETAWTMNNTGGYSFRLLRPLSITEADVSTGTSFTVLYIFSPDGFVLGGHDDDYFNGSVGDGTYAISLPSIEVTPVAFRTGDSLRRETYVFDVPVTDSANACRARLEIYSTSSDPGNVYAASLRYLPLAESGLIPPRGWRIDGANSSGDTLDFVSDYSDLVLVGSFRRLESIGASGTADLRFNAQYNGTDPVLVEDVPYALVDSSAVAQ